MNNINNFNLKRVVSLCKMIIAEQPRVFMMLSLLLLGVMSLAFVFINLSTYNYSSADFEAARAAIYIIFVFYGMIFTSLAFGKMRDKKGRTSLLMLPALQIEKYIANFIVYVIMYVVIFAFAVYLADIIRMIVMSVLPLRAEVDIYPLQLSSLWCEDTANTMAAYMFLQSFYWLGSLLWPHNSFIKTYSALTILGMFYIFTGMCLYKLIIGSHSYHLTMFDDEPLNTEPIMWAIVVATFVINYTIAYIRLKETDVVQKLL